MKLFPKGKQCMWRQLPDGNNRDCNGAGQPGEVVLFKSGIGGYPADVDEHQCNTGYKFFTCPFPQYFQLTENCRWTNW